MAQVGFFSLPREIRDEIYALAFPADKPYMLQDTSPFNYHYSVGGALRPFYTKQEDQFFQEARDYLLSRNVIALRDASIDQTIHATQDLITRELILDDGIEHVQVLNTVRYLEFLVPLARGSSTVGRKASTGSLGGFLKTLPNLVTLNVYYQRWDRRRDRSSDPQPYQPITFGAAWIQALQNIIEKIGRFVDARQDLSNVEVDIGLALQSRDYSDRKIVPLAEILKYWPIRGTEEGQKQLQEWNNGKVKAWLDDRNANQLHIMHQTNWDRSQVRATRYFDDFDDFDDVDDSDEFDGFDDFDDDLYENAGESGL